MKVKLKTIEQLIEEFEFEYDGYDYTTTFNGMYWLIDEVMIDYLGKEMEVEELYGYDNYTHKGLYTEWYWHESWFEPVFTPIEFINEVEFEL